MATFKQEQTVKERDREEHGRKYNEERWAKVERDGEREREKAEESKRKMDREMEMKGMHQRKREEVH